MELIYLKPIIHMALAFEDLFNFGIYHTSLLGIYIFFDIFGFFIMNNNLRYKVETNNKVLFINGFMESYIHCELLNYVDYVSVYKIILIVFLAFSDVQIYILNFNSSGSRARDDLILILASFYAELSREIIIYLFLFGNFTFPFIILIILNIGKKFLDKFLFENLNFVKLKERNVIDYDQDKDKDNL